MENSNKDEKGYVYVFKTKEEMATPPSKIQRKIRQIFPCVCGSMICLPFGIMLGWPSPTYPNLVTLYNPASILPISIDQSAMVAGFLMIGNTVATPFSSHHYLGAKYNLIIATVMMTAGWIVMWQAKDIYGLLASRFLIGAGYGYGVGQLKYYIREMCEPPLARTLIKQIGLYAFFGVIVAFTYGPYVEFKKFSIVAMIVSIFAVFLAVFLPLGPRQLLREGKDEHVAKSIVFLSPNANVEEEIERIKEQINNPEKEFGWKDLIKREELRKKFIIFAGLVFFQQFSGAPATIVYSQIIFKEAHCPRPELCAIAYALVYFLANIYGVFCVSDHNKKHLLLFSSVGVSLTLVVQLLVLVERVNELYWNFTSVLVLLVFNVLHTVGLGNVPAALMAEMFPKEAGKVVGHFFVMATSMLALTITKIFQVMMAYLGLFAPFCLFLTVSTASIIYVIIFVPNKKT